jgi:hypothetical protein
VDPTITRPHLVSYHTKWLYCSAAFWALGDQCETRQQFVPKGYFFETGRPSTLPPGTVCGDLTGYEPEVTVVKNCRVKKGLTMVLPAVNLLYVGCNTDTGELEDPRLGPAVLAELFPDVVFRKATLDNNNTEYLDSLKVLGQDGDFVARLTFGGATCTDGAGINLTLNKGCPVSALGPYVFIDTSKMTKGRHTLILIGELVSAGFCSAVRHEFTLV